MSKMTTKKVPSRNYSLVSYFLLICCTYLNITGNDLGSHYNKKKKTKTHFKEIGFFVEHKGDRARFEMHVWTAYVALLSLFEGRQVAPRVLLILI